MDLTSSFQVLSSIIFNLLLSPSNEFFRCQFVISGSVLKQLEFLFGIIFYSLHFFAETHHLVTQYDYLVC